MGNATVVPASVGSAVQEDVAKDAVREDIVATDSAALRFGGDGGGAEVTRMIERVFHKYCYSYSLVEWFVV